MCGSVEAELIAKWMEEGLGFQLTTMFVNDHLKQEEKKEESVKSVCNAFYRMKPLITRIEKKTQKSRTVGQSKIQLDHSIVSED